MAATPSENWIPLFVIALLLLKRNRGGKKEKCILFFLYSEEVFNKFAYSSSP